MAELVAPRAYYYPGAFVVRVINTIVGLIEALLALRLVLILLSANASSQVVAWIYSVTDALVGPFLGAFPAWNVGGFIVDISTIFAMIGYAVIGWLVIALLSFIFDSANRI